MTHPAPLPPGYKLVTEPGMQGHYLKWVGEGPDPHPTAQTPPQQEASR